LANNLVRLITSSTTDPVY